ncbi:Ubiquitinyl hydrolase 1 [Bertholletia excelsa]
MAAAVPCSIYVSSAAPGAVSVSRPAPDIIGSSRDAPPAHYILKIESFPSFLKNIEFHESAIFESGGYKWKLCLYPNGNKKREVKDHVSLYLAIAETKALPLGWEVNAICKFFVFDHIQNKYLTIQFEDDKCFHQLKTEWGFDKLLPLNALNDESKRYVLDDCCVFGAEVFVTNYSGKGEHLSMIPACKTYTWTIDNFSTRNEEEILSDDFCVGGHKWKLSVYPKGMDKYKGRYISIFLCLSDKGNLPPDRKLYALFIIRMKDQLRENHIEKEAAGNWFSIKDDSWGYKCFLPLRDLRDGSKGLMLNDSVIVEAQIKMLSKEF